MLTTQRKQLILTRLARDGQIVAKTLSAELGTSDDTIRRDLRELAQDGLLQRVHGGALPASPAVGTLAVRRDVAPDEKVALGRAGAAMIRPGQVVILDGGTTTTQLVRHLPRDLRCTIVTHSPAIAVELIEFVAIDVIVLGGRLFRHSMVNVGATTVEAAGRLRADLFFLGATGVHAQDGLSTGDFDEADIKRVLVGRAAETVVMASSEKLGAASPYRICASTDVDTLIVAATLDEAVTRPFEAAGLEIVPAA